MIRCHALRRAAPRCATGFTLVEVLVALLIMAVMAVMAWQGVDGIARSRTISQSRMEQTLRLNTVIAQWDQDLTSIQDTTVVPLSLSCDGTSVRLTRRTPDGLQVVAWSARSDDSGQSWVRWASPPATTVAALQDDWLRSLQLQGNEPGSLRALTGLSGWKVYFYQGNAWANCQSTGDLAASPSAGAAQSATPSAAPSAAASGAANGAGNGAANPASAPAAAVVPARTALPQGVRIVLSFAPGSGIEGDLTRDTLVGP
jgi:general secretion pathway protein J